MWIRWRLLVATICGILFCTIVKAESLERKDTILVVGDSLSAEYGIQRGSGWVSMISARLQAKDKGYQIHNTSISGDTTSGGLSRLPEALSRYNPDIVIIELGSNDALRGLPLRMTEDNLDKMTTLAEESGARVLLLGMQIPPNYGKAYADQFRQLFVSVATRQKAGLVPFFFDGIATDTSMFLHDGIHPNENAQKILADNVWTYLEAMLK